VPRDSGAIFRKEKQEIQRNLTIFGWLRRDKRRGGACGACLVYTIQIFSISSVVTIAWHRS